MSIYHIIYKTTHIRGKYYIGRHSTTNLDDGYLGSGNWVLGIKDKSTLSREIVAEADSIDKLKELEEYYISLHWDDPLCKNEKKSSNGLTSEDAKRISEKLLRNGTHSLMKRKDGSSVTSDKVKNGTHPWMKRNDGTSIASDRVKEGTHNFLTRPDGSSFASDRVKNGTHNFQTKSDGTSLSSTRVKEGTHNFLTRPDGTSFQQDRVKEGIHHFLGSVSCYNRQGERKQIPKDQYYSQSGPNEDWEWVSFNSKEGKKRKLK